VLDDGQPTTSGGGEALFTREEALGGLPARRAQALLFLIESRTAHLAARSQQTVAPFPTERSEQERELAFLEAYRLGRDPPLRPTIQQLEQYAVEWAELVPENVRLRAALARLIGRKYAFTRQSVPHLRQALGVDRPDVLAAYQRLYSASLVEIYALAASPLERVRWAWANVGRWLTGLPPRWFAFIFTFALGIPQATVALPIAVAPLGTGPGIGLMLLAGLVSVITVSCMAEAAARSGTVRYGNAYTGRLAADFLGPAGSAMLSAALFGLFLLAVIAGLIAMSRTLEQFSPLPAPIWTALLALGVLWLLSRGAVTFSLSVLVLISMVVLVSMGVLMWLELEHLNLENALQWRGGGTSPSSFENTVGVVLMVFFSEAFVVQCAKAVLPRDPSGRSLIWGSMAGLAAIGVALAFWIFLVDAIIPADVLAHETATVISPLTDHLGTAAVLPGFLLVLLLPGLAVIRCSIGLFNQVSEWLPAKQLVVLAVGAGQGRPLTEPSQKVLAGRLVGSSNPGLQDVRVRFIMASSPVVLALVVTEWLQLGGRDSFVAVLSVVGVLTSSIFSGFIPVMLLVASRRKGEVVPGLHWPFIGHPLVIGGIYALYLGVLVVHAGWVWDSPIERLAALATAVFVIVASVQIVRRGSFTPRMVIELRDDQRDGHQASFTITAVGRPAEAAVSLAYPDQTREQYGSSGEISWFDGLREASFAWDATEARELKVWVHRVGATGESEGLPAEIAVEAGAPEPGEDKTSLSRKLSGGQAVLPLGKGPGRLTIILPTLEA
jgi:amino acid permease